MWKGPLAQIEYRRAGRKFQDGMERVLHENEDEGGTRPGSSNDALRHHCHSRNTLISPHFVADFSTLTDESLLATRIQDLPLKIEGTPYATLIAKFRAELAAKGVPLVPEIYLGDEWFSPEGKVAIAIPFYLAHPRLISLEKKMMLEAEGAEPADFLKLLRHEAGHSLDHAYQLSKRPAWRRIFGSPDREYRPEHYRPRAYSRAYVNHLANSYAQSHPDEDFAETFAVWLTPGLDWEKEYADRPVALRKLRFIDEAVKTIVPKMLKRPKNLPYRAENMRSTLARYYQKKQKEYATDYPDFYDRDLKRIFRGTKPGEASGVRATVFLKRNGKTVIEAVSHWTGEKKYAVEGLLKRFSTRCEELELLAGDEPRTKLELAAYLSTLVTHARHTGRYEKGSSK